MKKRRLIVRNRKRKQAYLAIFVSIFLLFGLGYASIGSTLGITGSLGVTKYDHSLYSVFRREVSKGYAAEYTGAHQDSLDGSGNEKIYYWNAANDAHGVEILNRNNVIFANQCWQMVRTTDTGGVKLIYNGEVVDNKCLDTRENHIGYASLTQMDLSSAYYYYGSSYNYDKASGTFSLNGSGEASLWGAETASNIVGKYTCLSSGSSGSCGVLYYVESYYSDTTANVIPISNSSPYSQFGTLQFNSKNNSLAYNGYMYNNVYPSMQGFGTKEIVLYSAPIQTSYWYYTSGSPVYDVNEETGEYEWTFDSSFQIADESEYGSLVGTYTFQSDQDKTNHSTVQYIISVSGSTYYYINLVEGGFKDRYYFADEYEDNGDGTYRVLSAIIVDASNWASNYNRLRNKYVCKNSQTCSNLWFITDSDETGFSYSSVVSVYKYASGFTYDGSTYTLNDDSVSFWNVGENKTLLNNHHYTCWNSEGTCSELYYIYYVDGSSPNYIRLTNGKGVQEALDEMMNDEHLNTISSTMKNGVEAWYRNTLSSYDSYMEDVIYCGDRSILNLNGWNPNGGDVSLPLQYRNASLSTDLSCPNVKDRFAVGNSSAPLTHKVGLLTSSEANLYNNPFARRTGHYYTLMTPNYFSYEAIGYRVDFDGYIYNVPTTNYDGVRPVISLIPGVEFVAGDGTMASPYVIG